MTGYKYGNRTGGHSELAALKVLLRAEAHTLREKSGCTAPPYNPEAVADFLNVKIEEQYLNGADGFVELRDSQHVAVISTKSNPLRQRFTLAHELGHVLLMKLEEKGTCMPLRRYRMKQVRSLTHHDPVEESLCNYFASELLMPLSDVERRLNRQSLRPQTITDLASEFYVSKQAAAVKIFKHRLDVKACALWSLDSLWPMAVWWAGKKTRNLDDITKLENLVARREHLSEIWGSYDYGNRRVRVMVSPAGLRFAMVLVTDAKRIF